MHENCASEDGYHLDHFEFEESLTDFTDLSDMGHAAIRVLRHTSGIVFVLHRCHTLWDLIGIDGPAVWHGVALDHEVATGLRRVAEHRAAATARGSAPTG